MKLKLNKKVQFDELTHSYFCGDNELVGVTTLMKHQGLSPDYSGIDEHVLNHAAARGTAIHRTLELYDNGESLAIPIEVDDNEGGKIKFDTSEELKAYKNLGLNILASEYLVSDNKVVASSIDKVAMTEDENMVDLIDVKTTYTLHIDALEWQLSIYAYLFELQNKGIKVRNLYGCHVRDGKAKMQLVRRIEKDIVKDLIKCEADGTRFTIKETPTTLSLVLSEDEIPALIADERECMKLKEALKAIDDRISERRGRIYEYMLNNGIKEIRGGDGFYKLKNPTTRESFDSKRFRDEHPDLHAQYLKISEVKGNVTFHE